MKVRLIERGTTTEPTREMPITRSEFLIGRGGDCDFRLRLSSISRHHCLIRLDTDGATLVDLGSSNGTFLNDNRVRSQAPLHSGDVLRIGACSFTVDLGDEERPELRLPAGVDSMAVTVKLRDLKEQAPPAPDAGRPTPPEGETTAH
jgi:pSer/pThr/pTyr-binding forkhead associated (FHA) protein